MSLSQFLKKNKYTEKSGKNKEAAIEAALKELNVSREEVEIEVLDEGSKGFLGIGARDARVKVTLKNDTVSDAVGETTEDKKPRPVVKSERVKKQPSQNGIEEDAKKFLADIFEAMNLGVDIDVTLDEQSLTINLSGENMGIIIGKRGDTLDSLQYLTSLVVNQRSQDYIKVSIDTENYREKRSDTLLALSKRLEEKVTRTGKKFTLEPMNPYERRIIHSNLQNSETVTTYSIGQEPYRKVVIAPKNAKYKKDGYRKRNQRSPRKEKTDEEKLEPGYATTYKADFKPQQHKAEYKNFEDYLAAHQSDDTEE
ncbi:MAG: protein jag [Oscillospiraceae bacterium]|nr:protein jag [Oscillospiraceae bacterium]